MQEAYFQIVRFGRELRSQILQLRFELETWLPYGHSGRTFIMMHVKCKYTHGESNFYADSTEDALGYHYHFQL